MLSVAELDEACAPIIATLRHRGDIPAAELDACVPSLEAPAADWLRCYGQLNRWLAAAPAREQASAHAVADRAILDAQRHAPVPVHGTTLRVYPKSFSTLLRLAELDSQLDGLVRMFAVCAETEATAQQRDQLERLALGIERAQLLIVWAWTTPGTGLPWAPHASAGELPGEMLALLPEELLSVHASVSLLHQRLQSLSVLLDPIRREAGGTRPTWSGLFQAMGFEMGQAPAELLESQSLEAVLAMAQLQAARMQPTEAAS